VRFVLTGNPLLLFTITLLLLLPTVAVAQHDHTHEAQAPAQSGGLQKPPDDQILHVNAFNHRLAGVFVLLAGLVVLGQSKFAEKVPVTRYLWPALLFFPGVYLLVLSDPETWPLGPVPLLAALRQDQEVMQHKIFSILLLALGSIEFLRARSTLTARWSAFGFPILALGGSLLLLVHPHNPGTHGADHMSVMQNVEAQHLWFTIVGIGIAIGKALAELNWAQRRAFAYAWPAMMMVLGALLIKFEP